MSHPEPPNAPEPPEEGTPPGEPAGSGGFLFPELPLGGPIEELETTADKRIQMHSRLGDKESEQRLRRALDLARDRLRAVLEAPSTTPGS